MQMKPLKKLLQDLEQEMLRLGYTEGSMKFYHSRWRMLIEFAEEKGEICYSEKLGIDFIEKHFHILEKDFSGTFTQAEVQNLRIIRMIGDFKTLRRFLEGVTTLETSGAVAMKLARQYVKLDIVQLGILYLDGHFVPYYGKSQIAKGYFTTRRLALKGNHLYSMDLPKYQRAAEKLCRKLNELEPITLDKNQFPIFYRAATKE